MKNHETRLERCETIAEGTMAFHFAKPPGFTFKPGQAIELILPELPENAGHAFSLVNAPFDDQLVIATRLRDSAYKRALRSLQPGSPVRVEGAFGSLTLHKDTARPAVFIVGGIGITPCISILRQATHDRLPQDLVLVYSNRRPEDAAFLDQLQQLAAQNSRFRLLATMTKMEASTRPWTGETGPVNESLLGKAAGQLVAPIYYLVGPPAMVESMRELLNRMGVDDDAIRSEEFFGY
ncbi:MAG: ferredoxin--NADP reductase [Bacteroidota bacterium]